MNTVGGHKSGVDWGDCWIKKQIERHHDDCPEYWDKRAKNFSSTLQPSDYILQFLDKLELEPGDTVFDMGCGNGTVAIPLGKAGYQVLACDFSQGMLNALEGSVKDNGLTTIETKCMSWEEDWEARGVRPKSYDVAFASRSVITKDLRESLMKLTAVARKRACATLGTGYAPHGSAHILRELGVTVFPEYDYQYAFNILVQEGYQPSVSFIRNDRRHHYVSREEARAAVEKMLKKVGPVLDEKEAIRAEELIDEWLDESLKPNERVGLVDGHGEIEGPFKIEIPNDIIWAFVSWDTERY